MVLQVIAIAFSAVGGNIASNMLFSLFFDVVLIILASQIKKQA